MARKIKFSGGLNKNSLNQRILLLIWKILKEIAKTPEELLEGTTTTAIMKSILLKKDI